MRCPAVYTGRSWIQKWILASFKEASFSLTGLVEKKSVTPQNFNHLQNTFIVTIWLVEKSRFLFALTLIVGRAVGPRFKSWTGQIKHSVVNDSPPCDISSKEDVFVGRAQ